MLNDLPVPWGYDNVQTAYLAERDKIKTLPDLQAFVVRWRPLLELGCFAEVPDDMASVNTMQALKTLLDNTYDAESTLACLTKCLAKEDCGHGPEGSCCAMHIMLPQSLFDAFQVSEHYGVPLDMALIQLNGGLEATLSKATTTQPKDTGP